MHSNGVGAMFQGLGRLVARVWPGLLAGWVVLLAWTWYAAPPWKSVAKEGEFNFLPPGALSRRSEDLYRRAFPGEASDSSLVIMVSREQGLRDADREFIDKQLK